MQDGSLNTIETILNSRNSGEMAGIKLRVESTQEINFAAEVKAGGGDREWNRLR